jgi:hypothetical protein
MCGNFISSLVPSALKGGGWENPMTYVPTSKSDFSALTPNQAKGGGWEIPAAVAAAVYTGGAAGGLWGAGAAPAASLSAADTSAYLGSVAGTTGGASADLGASYLGGAAGTGAAGMNIGAGLGVTSAADLGASYGAGAGADIASTGAGAAGDTAGAGAAGSGSSSWLDAAKSALMKSPLQTTALGLAGYNALTAQTPQLNPQLMGLAQGPQQAANTAYGQYSSGQLAPSDQLAIAQWQQGQEQQLKNYYAQAGLGDSSMAQQALGQIGTQANAMRDQARQGYLQQALQATGAAGQPISQAVYSQLAQDQQARDAQQNFMSTLAMMGQTPAGG